MEEVKRWVTWRGRRLPIGSDGKILQIKQEQADALKSRDSFIAYGMDGVVDKRIELRYADSSYRRINDIKKAYKKRKEAFPENLNDYWQEEKRKRDEIQAKYNQEVEKYKKSVWGQIQILDK